jgi:mRNA-degrading endonuclease YafQ of YafQ-DinJ toxin-antitoxin module
MKHKIEYPKSFAKKAKKLINANPALKNKLKETLLN